VIKPLVAAAALDAGVVTSHEQLDCEHGKYHYGTHIINDTHPNDIISFHDVVVRSSNIGMTKVGDRMGKERLYGALRRFGFGEVTGLHLPGETAGILRRPEGWSKVDIATHSFGQGVAVTPLQIARAMAAIANGGLLPPLKIVLDAHYPPPVRVVSAAAAEETKSMLYGVVTAEKGTAPLAAIPGVQIGGKTGTAQKANPRGGGYLQGAYMASFVGFAEASAIGVPRLLTLIIVIDEPDNGSIYGGVVAAPVFRRVMQRTLHLLATRQEFAPSGTTASRAVRLPYG
jgi:cell division protein FtsI (penicillin-binding protein 3)